MFASQLEKDTKLDRLRMEESKERIILRNRGGIFIISVQAGNSKKGVESAMGAGARIVIQDESCLIPDSIEATVFRMIAGKGQNAFYCKIGNPFYRNHFLKSWEDPGYHRIFIDYKRGIKEGRYTPEFIAEARKKPLFDILYGCIFPGSSMLDPSGYLQLMPEEKILIRPTLGETLWIGQTILGIDPSGEGNDDCTFVLRDRFKMQLADKIKSTNPREIVERGLTLIDALKRRGTIIQAKDVVIDSFGIGSDCGKEFALATKGEMEVYTVLLGNAPQVEEEYNARFFRRRDEEVAFEDEKDGEKRDIYLNLRALMYFRMRSWLLAGGQYVDEDVDNSQFKAEASVIKYKRSLQGNKIQLMPKKDMAALGIPSPNIADAGALTLLRELDMVVQSKEELDAIADEEKEFDPHSVF